MKKSFDEESFTLLRACEKGRIDLLQELIRTNQNIEETNLDGQTPLIIASIFGNDQIVSDLIKHGANVNAKDQKGRTPIIWASFKGKVKIISVLLANGASIEDRDHEGATSLIWARMRGVQDSVLLLVERGAQIHEKDWDGNTCLVWASKFGLIKIVSALLLRGANVHDLDRKGKTSLMWARFRDNMEMALILVEHGSNYAEKNHEGKTTFLWACERGHLSIVSFLLSKDPSVLRDCDQMGRTGLHLASQGGHCNLLSFLLSNGASLEEKDNFGRNSYLIACESGSQEAVSYLYPLLSSSSSSSFSSFSLIRDNSGLTGLMLACCEGRLSLIPLLLSLGENIKDIDHFGRSALLLASERGHEEVVSFLLDNGADIEETDKEGNSSLLLACASGKEQVVSTLLKRGANIHSKNIDSISSIIKASQNGHSSIVSLLLESGADIEDQDQLGKTSLFLACEQGQKDSLVLLLQHRANHLHRDQSESTCFLRTCATGHTHLLSVLLSLNGISLEDQDQNGRSGLMLACEAGHLSMTSRLIKLGAEINSQDKRGMSALLHATTSGNQELIRFLIKNGANLHQTDQFQNDSLMISAMKGDVSMVNLLIDLGMDVNAKNQNGDSGLMLATERGHLPVVSLLIQRGATHFHETNDSGFNARQLTTDPLLTSLLEKSENDLNDRKQSGWTQLMFSIWFGSTPSLSFLISNEDIINKQSNDGLTALMLASQRGNQEAVSLLLENGALIHIEEKSGSTALTIACQEGFDNIVILLLSRSSFSQPSQELTRCFEMASQKKHSRILLLLYSKGANLINVSTNDWRDSDFFSSTTFKVQAFHLSCQLWGVEEVSSHLKSDQESLFLNAKNEDGLSPLFIAAKHGRKEIVQYLIEYPQVELSLNSRNILLFSRDHNQHSTASLIWSLFVQNERFSGLVRESLEADPSIYSLLDDQGRQISSSLAIRPIVDVMNDVLLWFGRYRLLEDRPEHQSSTCVVFKAEDQLLRDESGSKRKVALKLMYREDQFLREINLRRELSLNSTYVVEILAYHTPTSDLIHSPRELPVFPTSFTNKSSMKSSAERMYALSFPLSDRNLFDVLHYERNSLQDSMTLKNIISELSRCILHLHSQNIILTNIHPNNFLRISGKWKFSDLSTSFSHDEHHNQPLSFWNFSPPEAFFVNGVMKMLSNDQTTSTSSRDSLFLHPTFDVWSLGCIFYIMCTGGRLLFSEYENSMSDLAEWTDELKTQKLSLISDPLARNLLSQMLMKDPSKRPSISRILDHPFFTGRSVARLVGQEPEFDVFLSYRSWTDLSTAWNLYDLLISKGLTVQFDRDFLVKDWEESLIDGLTSSRVFVPIYSKLGFSAVSVMDSYSPCDYFLLENQLALELIELGLIEKILPVWIDESKDINSQFDFFPLIPDIVVNIIEEKTIFHLSSRALGDPKNINRTIKSLVDELKMKPHLKLNNSVHTQLQEVTETIYDHVKDQDAQLFEACKLGAREQLDICLKRGAEINSIDKDGLFPLFIAAKHGRKEIVQYLMESTHTQTQIKLSLNSRNILLFSRDHNQHSTASLIWSLFVQNERFSGLVRESLEADPSIYSLQDDQGRQISSLAIRSIVDVMNDVLLWFGRYRLLEDRPEHQSSTCVVFKAEDQLLRDESGSKRKVALKLMYREDQFLREINLRNEYNFDDCHVMNILAHHLRKIGSFSTPRDESGSDLLIEGKLTKELAEQSFAISLPLADRNLFVALKQERFAGINWNRIKFICKDLLSAVSHIHSKGVIHADLKPLNIVRVHGDWRLIDLDASCRIGIDYTGLKSSSAFVPPEAIHVDRRIVPPHAMVKSQDHLDRISSDRLMPYELLLAHPSFDVWSLGCIFYIMCTDCRYLFQGGQDDTLRDDQNDDSLLDLAEWTDELKTQKLSLISDPLARNLLSQMLMKDPSKRPTISRILDHPFFTGKRTSRLVGQKPEFDVFLSYRVSTDANHAKHIYDILTCQGVKVWLDKIELKPGENWEEGFCNGLVNSRYFVPLLSQQALSNFSTLVDSSPCDNVLLEHRLAFELKEFGFIDKIFPLLIGEPLTSSTDILMTDFNAPNIYKIDWKVFYPVCQDVCVSSLEEKIGMHLNSQALGTPLQPFRTVLSVMNEMRLMQGAVIDGEYTLKMQDATATIRSFRF